jgi:hypothetical protein
VIIPIGFGEATIRILLTGDPEEMNCVFGFEVSSPPFTQSDANDISTAVATFIKPMLATTATYVGLDIRIGSDGAPLLFSTVTGSGAGTSSSAVLPQNCAWLMRKNTGLGGRANKGRMFVPGVPEAAVDNAGVIVSGNVTTVNTAAATFLTTLSGLGNEMVLLHSDDLNDPDTVITFICDTRIATQRRRLR